MPTSEHGPSDARIRLAKEFIEAGKQLVLPFEPAPGDAAARGIEAAISNEDRFQEIAIAFAEFFTDEELKGLIAFYRSPLGKRLIEARTALTPRLAKTIREMYKGRFEAWATRLGSEANE